MISAALFQCWRNLRQLLSPRRYQPAQPTARPCLEALEDRCLLSSSPLILLTDSTLASLQQQAASNTPQWQAFESRLNANLPNLLSSGAYQGSELTWIADYALGYQVLKSSDPSTADNFADKAIALLKSALNDYQKAGETTLQFLTRGDAATTSFTLPNSDLIPASLKVYLAPVSTTAVFRGSGSTDTVGYYQKLLKVSNTADGNADYIEGTDWIHDPNLPNNDIEWLPGGHQPAAGATYYVTETSSMSATSVAYTLSGNTITLASAPSSAQAVFVEYVYGTHSADGSSLAYQQTSAGDGGFNSIYIDDTYTSRYLGKYVALGLNWLGGYAGLSSSLQSQAVSTLQQWFNYLSSNGYYYNSPASNYGAGSYVSQVFTALALQGQSSTAPQMLSDMLAYRSSNVLPLLHNASTSLNGGFWAEGWNYGQMATENLLEAGLALQDAGQVTATAESQWASQVIEQLLEASPSAGTIYDGGDWFASPAPFPGNELFDVLAATASDPTQVAYANEVLQSNAPGNSNDAWDLLLRNPSASASSWSGLPLQYLASGTGLLTARSDWGSTPTWVSEQMGNLLQADHQSYTPGQLQIQRGGDDLLVNASALGGYQGLQKSTYGNTIVVNDNGDGVQNYPYSMGIWYGTPGVTVTDYEASGNHVYMAGNYAAAYSLNTNPGGGGPVSELTREMVYLRPDYVIVYDRVTTLKDSYAKLLQWNFLNAPTLSGNSFTESVGSSKLFGQTFSTVPLSTTVAAVTVGSATVQEVRTQNASATASVRYVTAFETASSTTTAMDATEHVVSADGRMEGTQVGNELVLFARSAGAVDLSSAVSYALSGSSAVDNLLVDVQAGQVYQVQVDGVVQGNVTASSQGTLSFTTPAGAQQVSVVLSGVVVNGTGGNDTLTLSQTSGGGLGAITYVLNGGPPVNLTHISSFTFKDTGSNNVMTVHIPSSGALLSGPVIFASGSTGNVLNLDANNLTVISQPSSFLAGGMQAVQVSNVGGINIQNAAAVVAFPGPDTADRVTAFSGLTAQERFVQALYLEALGRAGSKDELDGWTPLFGTPGLNQQQAQEIIARCIEHSQESYTRLVQGWYVSYLGRKAQGEGEVAGWVGELQAGLSEEAVLSQLLSTAEFYARAQRLSSSGSADERYVQALYMVLLGRQGPASDVAAYASTMAQLGRQGVALTFLKSQELRQDQVAAYYAALLHRPGKAADLQGWAASGLDFATVLIDFEASAEFFQQG